MNVRKFLESGVENARKAMSELVMKSVTARLTEGDLRCSYPHVLAAKIDTYLDADLSKERFFFLLQ